MTKIVIKSFQTCCFNIKITASHAEMKPDRTGIYTKIQVSTGDFFYIV